jgi:serine/threonine protein kinase
MAEHQKYRITERIDAGGMAEVFRGVAESIQGFKKSVAIKRILPHLTRNRKFISMFLDEARLSLHLQHANVVSIFDIGVSGEGAAASYFIVMEYVDGTHLKGLVESARRQGRSLTVSQVLYIMMQVCAGLAYAHDFADPETGRPLGIVHRDISPPNILLSKNGEVKLVDFGLAKATSQIESTDPGVVKGNFSYLSPEAANGREVDRRADIFAVGILLYELLTGKRLFYGDSDYQTVELVRQAHVPSVMQQNPGVEGELDAIIRKALARDLSARFQTAGELQDALAQYLFSRGMKVTSRDVADLVRTCQAERARTSDGAAKQSLIDTLILEELNKFTSIDDNSPAGSAPLQGAGARPLSPDDLNGRSQSQALPVDVGPLIDTSSWSEELAVEPSRPVPARVAEAGTRAIVTRGQGAQNGAARSAPEAPPPREYRPRPTPTQPVLETDLMEVGSLEEMLEGGTRPLPERPIEPIQLEPVTGTRKVRSPGLLRAPVVFVLLVLGAAAAWLLSLLLRGHGLGGP